MNKIATYIRDMADWKFALIVACLVTFFVFSPFVGQELYSDVVTFQATGDSLQQTYPAFVQAHKLLLNGVDINTWNGSTEMYLRGVLPMLYPPFLLFSLLGVQIGYRKAFFMFYVAHMVLFITFGILLGKEHFSLNRKHSCVFTLSALTSLLIGAWFTSYYIILSWITPALYSSIKALKTTSKQKWILSSLPYVALLCGGYIPLAIFSCIVVFGIALLYALLWEKEEKFPLAALLSPAISAGIVVFFYYVEMAIYKIAIVGGGGATTLKIVTSSYPLTAKELIAIISMAFTDTIAEPHMVYYIGFAWFFILASFLLLNRKILLNGRQKAFILAIVGIVIVFIFISIGRIAVMQYWYYALVPVLGAMHLPVRFLLVLMPLFFLAATLILARMDESIPAKFWNLALIADLGGLGALLLIRTDIPAVNDDMLIVELMLFAIFLCLGRKNQASTLYFLVFVLCTNLMPMGFYFYSEINNNFNEYELKNYSIVYDSDKIRIMDEFVGTLPEKEIYKFINFDADNGVPFFMPCNYGWYAKSKYELTNYYGYEPHISVPEEYRLNVGVYTPPNWEYVVDTQGDFAVIEDATISSDFDFYSKILDMDRPGPYLDATHRAYALRRFIPYHYTGNSFVISAQDALDNGYFYCPSLIQEQLIRFDTDKKTYFAAQIDSDENCEVAFCLYPNRYYHYYVDGKEIEPIIDGMQAFIPISTGVHSIKVKYENNVTYIMLGIMIVYYIAWTTIGLLQVYDNRKKKII